MSETLYPFRQELVALIPRMRRFARSLTRNQAEADDLVQDALERALAREAQWQVGTRLDSWLYRILQNLWIDRCRRDKRQGPHVETEMAQELTGSDGREVFETQMQLQDADRALATLPEDQRVTVVLVLVEGLSYQEASEIMEVPPGTVASRLARAKTALEQWHGRGSRLAGAAS